MLNHYVSYTVGTKSDLLRDAKLVNDCKKQGIFPVTREEAENFALEHGVNYFETSALLGENVKDVFDVLIQSYYTTTDMYKVSIQLFLIN